MARTNGGSTSKSGNKPLEIPFRPERTIQEQWKGFGDWLGTGAIATFNRKYLDFEAARAHVRALKLKGQDAMGGSIVNLERKPPEIPVSSRKDIQEAMEGSRRLAGYRSNCNIQ